MKTFFKSLVLIAVVQFFAPELSAQQLQVGDKQIQAGIGLGGWETYSNESPIISLSYMHGIKDNFLNGKLAVGGSIGYKSAAYDGFSTRWNWRYTFVSARGTWHPNFIKSEKFDAYAGLGLGYLNVSVDLEGDISGLDVSGSDIVLAALIGARYSFTENLGAYAEIGNNLGYLTLGASYPF